MKKGYYSIDQTYREIKEAYRGSSWNMNTTPVTPKKKAEKLVSRNFNAVLASAEALRAEDQWGQRYCVCIRYGVYGSFTLNYALKHDYHIVCITL